VQARGELERSFELTEEALAATRDAHPRITHRATEILQRPALHFAQLSMHLFVHHFASLSRGVV
jgi:hypothetical protein